MIKNVYKVTEENADAKTGGILRTIEHLVCKYKYLLPGGWRCIVKMQVAGDAEPFYELDVESNRGGGLYAPAKMSTLEMFPERAATGGDDIRSLSKMLADLGQNGTPWAREIRRLEDVSQMTEVMWIWLRDEMGIAPCYGGLRAPYEDMVVEGSEITTETGEIRIAFSGATEEQDVFFALFILRELNASFVNLYPNVQGWINLRGLAEIPAIRFWLDLLEIEEA